MRGACEILGLDPLYVANEGRFVAFVPADSAELTVATLRGFGDRVSVIGSVEASGNSGTVYLNTIGGIRCLDMLTGEQLPRIC